MESASRQDVSSLGSTCSYVKAYSEFVAQWLYPAYHVWKYALFTPLRHLLELEL